jgi:hypothetical protein
MKASRLPKILAMIAATTALGARGIPCAPCPPDYTEIKALVPPSSDGGLSDAGDFVANECKRLCAEAISCEPITLELDGGSALAIECTLPGDCTGGRRPAGLSAPVFADSSATPAGWLARAAFLEAASVGAFRALGRDLAGLGAPRRLVRAAARAARDERRHARTMGAIARRYGASPPAPEARAGASDTLEALAAHNAAEGCVRETFGALMAAWQAEVAGDRELRSAMARISAEEARHAALAWQIDAWARRRLAPAARARVDHARDEAVRELLSGVTRPVPEALRRAMGLPERPIAAELARRMIAALGLS